MTLGLPARARPLSSASRVMAVLGACAALAGCGGVVSDIFPPACPHAGILADAADLTRYRHGTSGHDLTDMVLDGRITGVAGTCSRNGRLVDVTVAVSMQLSRGPAAGRGRAEVPFFVAVTRNGDVLDKQIYRVIPGFAPNADSTRLTSDPVILTLPTSSSQPSSGFDVVVGFQLTPEEVAFNRRRGPR